MLAALTATAALAVAPPPAGAPFSYQIGGAFPVSDPAMVVDRDRSDAPLAGHYSVCYVNAFQAQPAAIGWWRRRHPGLLLRRRGREVVDRAWHETLLDPSTPGRRAALAAIVGRWIDGCARSGFRAVEPDNLDSWTRSHGRLRRSDAIAFARLLAARAHARGLAIAQKNAAELAPAGPGIGFDFAIAEECQIYAECGAYERAYGGRVIEIEYGRAAFAAACRARGGRVSVVLRDRDVTPLGRPGAVERRCR